MAERVLSAATLVALDAQDAELVVAWGPVGEDLRALGASLVERFGALPR